MLAVPTLQNLGIIGLLAWIILFAIGAGWFIFRDWDWRHDFYVLADDNITIINRRPLWIQSENDQVLLRQVDNVVAEVRGPLQRMLNYGDVRISLVGGDQAKLFDNIAKPTEVQDAISRRRNYLEKRESEKRSQQQREIIGEYLSLYHEMAGGQPAEGNMNAQASDDHRPQDPNQPRAASLHDRNRPPNVPRQNRPSGPRISQGRPYQPNQTVAQQNDQALPYSQQPSQQNDQALPYSQASNPPNQTPQYGNPATPQQNPSVYNPAQDAPPQPPAYNPNQRPQNPPPPKRERDSGRPPKFPRRRDDFS
jgi:hypothetical protein